MDLKTIENVYNVNKVIFDSLMTGREYVRPADVTAAALANHRLLHDGDNMKHVLNANTIDADLQRHAVLQFALAAFKRRITPLGIFSTRFNNVALEGTNKVLVPYFPADTQASKDFADGTGYEFDTDTDTQGKEITVDKRKYQPFNFYSHQLSRQPAFNVAQLMAKKVEQLALDVWTDTLSLVTAANYGDSVNAEPADSFDSDDVLEIEGACDEADWPDTGRSLVLATNYHTNLLKDPAVKRFDQSGSDGALREGSTGRIGRFDIFHTPRLPHNSQNLTGFACLPSAILFATSPIMPGPGVRRQLVSYDIIMDPDLGIGFEYRYWGSADQDEEREVVEVNYGRAVGEAAALKRVVSTEE